MSMNDDKPTYDELVEVVNAIDRIYSRGGCMTEAIYVRNRSADLAARLRSAVPTELPKLAKLCEWLRGKEVEFKGLGVEYACVVNRHSGGKVRNLFFEYR